MEARPGFKCHTEAQSRLLSTFRQVLPVSAMPFLLQGTISTTSAGSFYFVLLLGFLPLLVYDAGFWL